MVIASSGQSHQKDNPYPSSAPDTMCSSLIRWIQSMEPLERDSVRDKVQPSHQPLESRHATADCLTGGHRRQAGIPLESSTHAQSHPGPQLSHSTLGSGHPMQPQHPGAQSWREEKSVTCELRGIREPAFTCYLPERTHRVST